MSRLDGLAAQRAAMTPGPWVQRPRVGTWRIVVDDRDNVIAAELGDADAEGVVAVVNAHDQLVAIARAAKAYLAARDADVIADDAIHAARRALRAALAAFEAGDPT